MLMLFSGLVKVFNAVFAFFANKDAQSTGAALQRGADAEAELKRVVKTNEEKSKAVAASSNASQLERVLKRDKNNRDNQ
jgi:hypothetical protein